MSSENQGSQNDTVNGSGNGGNGDGNGSANGNGNGHHEGGEGEKIRLLVVDDHPVVRMGVRRTLIRNATIEIVGEAGDGKEALDKAQELNPDVILMDVVMPVMGGAQSTRLIRAAIPKARILVFTARSEKEYVLEMLRAGAHGYLLKSDSPSRLLSAIDRVHRGEPFFSASVSEVVLKDYMQHLAEMGARCRSDLSNRQREVLALIAGGYSNKQIADSLGVSVRTIETHREILMQKLDIHSATGLTKYAIEKGIVALK
jgi:two-component system nitrate/nitrite response regulator NarL